MAKRKPAESDIDDDGEDLGTAEDQETGGFSKTKMIACRVKAGQTVILGETDDDGETREKKYVAGDSISVSEYDLRQRPWCFDVGERRQRGGQTVRLQKKVAALEKEIEDLKAEAKLRAKRDPGRDAAVESVLARGDNFGGRGEPSLGSVPREVVEAHEAGIDLSVSAPKGLTLDEETGFRGRGGEQAGGPEAGIEAGQGPRSRGSNPKPGESVRPGETEASDKPDNAT